MLTIEKQVSRMRLARSQAARLTYVATPQPRVIRFKVVSIQSQLRETSPVQASWIGFLQRIAGGEHAALAELYDVSSHLVFGLALRILGERDAAEDAVVEVYTQVWRAAKTYDPARGSPSSWLLNLSRSRAIDLRRTRQRQEVTDPLESAGEVASSGPDPEESSATAERDRLVRHALGALSNDQREPIELAFFAGLSHSEIAARLGKPLGTIKTRIRLGMTRLREQLGHLAVAIPTRD